ncbi:uncharacterized protein LOC126892411 [Diabrotica virgifera virgifera]|uniref:Ig-like domain-containing protein n=1 Tax=Diabrotica virgifera virgifera TaxID=50390 RepID=A0ABM5L632_DIAVI|nr:uncharacterized protein LOC126892411 [Diabrotica virgifera virgifera]
MFNNIMYVFIKMQYFFKCAVCLVFVVFHIIYCWNWNDVYDNLPTIHIKTKIGSQVTMVCEDDLELELVEWIHNDDKIFYPDDSEIINIDWVNGSNINLTINSEEDGGKWECWNYGFLVNRYQIEVKPTINIFKSNVTEVTFPTTKEGSYSKNSAKSYAKTNETSKKSSLKSSLASSESVNKSLSDSNLTPISPDQHNLFVEEKDIKVVPVDNTLHKTASNKLPENEANLLVDDLVKTL